MNKDYVKNLFEEIIKEASIGSVNALFHFGIIFETQIDNVKVTKCMSVCATFYIC